MRRVRNTAFSALLCALTALTVLTLAFVIYFIVQEALPTFEEVPLREFLFGRRWMPIDYTGAGASFGIFNFIMGTLSVSLIAMLLASLVGLGAAVFLSCVAGARTRAVLYPLIDLLAGIPSVVYGLVGMILLDYVLAFSFLGLSCVFAKPFKNKLVGVAVGSAAVCVLRFLCSFLSGVLIWGNLSDGLPAWIYSLTYNGSYMLPEGIMTTIAVVLLYKAAPQLFSANN